MVDTELRSRLDALRTEMDAIEERITASASRTPVASSRPRRRRTRTLVAMAVLALAIAVPGAVLANHQFSDVPNSNTFHASIAKIKTAGITGGCSTTKYCPNDAVTRGQMAAFLQRASGRGNVFDDSSIGINDGDVVATGSITTPGAGFILATASAMAYTYDTSGCPCEIDLTLYGPDAQSSYYFAQTLYDAPGVEEAAFASLSNTWMFAVEAGGTHTVDAFMERYTGSASVSADVTMTLLWVPFDETGDAFGGFLTAGATQARSR